MNAEVSGSEICSEKKMKTVHHHTCNPCSLLHKLLLFIPSPRHLRVLGVSVLNLSTVCRVPHLASAKPCEAGSAFRIFLLPLLLCLSAALLSAAPSDPYLGSKSCRSCHEKFYQLWSTSHHGFAMRPCDDSFAQANFTPPDADTPAG